MIKINFDPIFSDENITLSINNDVLTYNSIDYDLSLLEDGATAKHPMLGNVMRSGSDYELTLLLSHGFDAPEAHRFPAPIAVTDSEWVFDYDQLVSTRS